MFKVNNTSSSQQELLFCYMFDHVSSNISCDYCVTCASLFNLRHHRDFTSHTSRKGTLYIYVLLSARAYAIRPSTTRAGRYGASRVGGRGRGMTTFVLPTRKIGEKPSAASVNESDG